MKYTDVKQAKARAADNTTASLIPTEHAQGCKMCFCVGFPCPYCVYLCEGEKTTLFCAIASSACRYPLCGSITRRRPS